MKQRSEEVKTNIAKQDRTEYMRKYRQEHKQGNLNHEDSN